ncbi:DNA-3-methyladenine glycosylase [Microlunatus soli]|uniref:Putative 3-methyladenine DNA glycosylase n=1 Tax=Microlunatus soli TaxID=630515 RepID=A0A1H1VAH9_9ACTN|nr:DNA-3-methyladenine glycosylase [Microlunatus soli]SDS81673.1 DNA-3-methyladenine glycosylase [Microlunatus soli]
MELSRERDLSGDVETAARALLGCLIRRGPVAVRIAEVEAYDGPTDPAAHTHNGKTDRNWVMFGPAGHLYVYFSYGMHHAANVSAGPVGRGSGVLLRSGEVVDGIGIARDRRGPRISDRDLARGPGRLTQALGITRPDNGTDLLAAGPEPTITLTASESPVIKINTGPRVGITKAVDKPWRFWIADDPYVSDYRPGVIRARSAKTSASE